MYIFLPFSSVPSHCSFCPTEDNAGLCLLDVFRAFFFFSCFHLYFFQSEEHFEKKNRLL